MAKLPLMENGQCENWFASQGKKIKLRDEHICAGYEEGQQDGCQVGKSEAFLSNSIPELTVAQSPHFVKNTSIKTLELL